MLKKDLFLWTTATEEAFKKLKIAMMQAPVLSLPDFFKPFIIECDASGVGISAILLQDRPIAYFSQALHRKNLLLSMYEKEIIALVIAVQKWRPYLIGRKFIVRTDHRSLKHLWTQKITKTAQQRWLYKLVGFDFEIEYKKGGDNVAADALSRRHEVEQFEASLLAFSQSIPHWVDAIKEALESGFAIKESIEKI